MSLPSNACWLKCYLALIGIALSNYAAAQTVRLEAIQDNSIVLVDGEWEENAGQNARIRIKGNQHIVAIAFDMTPVQGRRVKRAELICHAGAETIQGISISTIATPWSEQHSNGLTSGVESTVGWGYEGARFPAVCGGNAFSLVHQTQSAPVDGVYRWEVPADLVHALSTGVAFGLALHEHDADYSRNPTIFSREQSGKQPVLVVELDSGDEPAPVAPTNLKLVPVDRTTAMLEFVGAASGFAYEVMIDDVLVARHNLPLVNPGESQVIHLRDLPIEATEPGEQQVSIRTISRTGQKSTSAAVKGELFRESPLELPNTERRDSSTQERANVGVIPINDKYTREGMAIGPLADDYRSNNSLFDGQTIRLIGAAGEVVSFQLLLRGEGRAEPKVEFEEQQLRVDLFQAVYVPHEGNWIPDPLIPIASSIPLSSEQDSSVCVDVFIPFDATAGLRRGWIQWSPEERLPIELDVLDVQLPRQATFRCEMNGYGLPDTVAEFYALQQVAYDHRVHCNILHYSHHTAAPGARKSNLDMRLASGRRMNNQRYDSIQPGATTGYWDDFIAAFGPYLDGSYFSEGHRGPIAAPGFYLTFHESWPLNCRAYFNGSLDAYEAFRDQPVYKQTYMNIITDFARVAREQGWNEAGFQVYFNNKGSLNEPTKAPWILDEPASFWDYRALQYYGELTDEGLSRQGGDRRLIPQVAYRIDISRPEFCRGQLASRDDLWVVSSWAFQHYRRLVTDRMLSDGVRVWVYGTANPVHEGNRQLLAWALDAWSHGAEGLVPWQTIDKSGNALKQPDQLGLFIFDRDDQGEVQIRHSMRLKAFRDAQQLVELLTLLKEKRNWSQSQMELFVSHYVSLKSDVQKTNDDDAGTSQYDRRSLTATDDLRNAVIQLLR